MKRDVGVSEAVSFIFVLLMILLLAAGVVLYGVPYIEEKKSTAESDSVLEQFSSLVSGMDELVLTKTYGVKRHAVFPAKYGTLSLSSDSDKRFALIYDSVSAKDIVFDGGVLSCGEYALRSAAGYMPAAAADAADAAAQKDTAVLSYSLLRIWEDNGMTYAEFLVSFV